MLKQMCWLPRLGDHNQEKILHLRTAPNQPWRPYTAFKQFAAPDYREPKGSKGWATFQKLRLQGWDLVASNEVQQFFEDDQKTA
jgi:hypothetical protein